jgi:hypothetical protein
VKPGVARLLAPAAVAVALLLAGQAGTDRLAMQADNALAAVQQRSGDLRAVVTARERLGRVHAALGRAATTSAPGDAARADHTRVELLRQTYAVERELGALVQAAPADSPVRRAADAALGRLDPYRRQAEAALDPNASNSAARAASLANADASYATLVDELDLLGDRVETSIGEANAALRVAARQTQSATAWLALLSAGVAAGVVAFAQRRPVAPGDPRTMPAAAPGADAGARPAAPAGHDLPTLMPEVVSPDYSGIERRGPDRPTNIVRAPFSPRQDRPPGAGSGGDWESF